MLPYFLRHYEVFADRIVIFDNYSDDRTAEICDAHPLCERRLWDTSGQLNNDCLRELKDDCWRHENCDWVIVVDIDEFLMHDDIEGLLDETANDVFIARGYVMVADRFPTHDDQIWKHDFLGIEGRNECKPCLFNARTVQEMNYKVGAHGAAPIRFDGKDLVVGTFEVALLHYRIFEDEWFWKRHTSLRARQCQNDIVNGWGGRYGNPQQSIDEAAKLRKYREPVVSMAPTV